MTNLLIIVLFSFLFVGFSLFTLLGWDGKGFLPTAWIVSAIGPQIYMYQIKVDIFHKSRIFFSIFLSNLCVMVCCMLIWDVLIRLVF